MIDLRRYFTKVDSIGRKRRFGIAGVANVLATNVLLQILLKIHVVPSSIAALASQIFNGCFGYLIYGSWVFRHRGNRRSRTTSFYALLMLFLWGINVVGIKILSSSAFFGDRNTAALAMITPLAVTSYLLQKNFVFVSID